MPLLLKQFYPIVSKELRQECIDRLDCPDCGSPISPMLCECSGCKRDFMELMLGQIDESWEVTYLEVPD